MFRHAYYFYSYFYFYIYDYDWKNWPTCSDPKILSLPINLKSLWWVSMLGCSIMLNLKWCLVLQYRRLDDEVEWFSSLDPQQTSRLSTLPLVINNRFLVSTYLYSKNRWLKECYFFWYNVCFNILYTQRKC